MTTSRRVTGLMAENERLTEAILDAVCSINETIDDQWVIPADVAFYVRDKLLAAVAPVEVNNA